MKKLIKVSLVAMLVATPMVASAALPDGVTYSNGTTEKPTITANDHVATTSFVRGAYDAAIDAVSAENARATGVEGSLDSLNADLKTLDAQENNVSTLVSALNKEDTKVGSLSTLTAATTGAFETAPADLATAVNTAMQTAKNAASGSDSKIGTLSSLDGSFSSDQKATVTAAINAVDGRVDILEGQMGNTSLSNVTGLTNTNVTGAIVELQSDKLEASKATVAEAAQGTYTAITAGDDVNTNLVNLDSHVKAAEGKIGDGTLSGFAEGVTTLTQAVNAAKAAADNAASGTSTAIGTKQSGNYITAGNTVAADLSALDTAVKTNSTAISAIEGTTLAVYGTWGASDSSSGTVALFPQNIAQPAANVNN